MIVLLLLSLLSLPKEPASRLAVMLVNTPMSAAELVSIARRESRGVSYKGVHDGDAWAEKRVWKRAHARGKLSAWCPFHWSPEGMSTRGVHGMMAGYSLHYLGACLPPQVLDVPLLSGIAAARRARRTCERYGACTRKARRLVWRGLVHWLRYKEKHG